MSSFYYSDSIKTLNLSRRSLNALERTGVNTIQDLLSLSMRDLLKIRNVGEKSRNEIINTIESFQQENNLFKKDTEVVVPSVKTFIGEDGKKYYDISIDEMALNMRTYNCLKNAQLCYYSELKEKTAEELSQIRSMGKKCLDEIDHILTHIELRQVMHGDNVELDHAEAICSLLFSVLNDILNLDPNQFFEKVLPLCLEVSSDLSEEETILSQDLLNCCYQNEYIQELFGSYVLKMIQEHIYGLSLENIFEYVPLEFRNQNFIKIVVNRLLHKKLIHKDELRYYALFPSYKDELQNYLTPREYLILNRRIHGETLEGVGQRYELTRERIRQIEQRAIKRLNDTKVCYKEDIYRDIYLRYHITYTDFMIAMSDSNVYNYLSLRYSQIRSKLADLKPIGDIVEDDEIPMSIRKKFERAIYKDYVLLDKEYIPCTRNDLTEYVLKHYSFDGVTFDEFKNLYAQVLSFIHRENDPSLNVIDRGYLNKLALSHHTLWRYGKKFRYYNIASYDYTELLTTLNLHQYDCVEYSTLKFFRLYPELMLFYDIRDEYELHNLLKKVCLEEDYPHVTFRRMPNIEFGQANRHEQVFHLLKILAPITKNDFSCEYENEYGVSSCTVLSNYMGDFNHYLNNGYYEIDSQPISVDIKEQLRMRLTGDFYLLSSIQEIYNDLDSAPHQDLNSIVLRELGYKVYSKYIIKDNYSTASEYFNAVLIQGDHFDLKDFPTGMKEVVAFINQLYYLKSQYQIVEYLPEKYINMRTLERYGITMESIKDFHYDVYNMIKDGEYFTYHSLKKQGYHSPLEHEQFEDWFYTSLLIERRDYFSHLKIGKNKIIYHGKKKFSLADFVHYIVQSHQDQAIALDDLILVLRNDYGLHINMWKLKESLKNSSMFIDAVHQYVYDSYDSYAKQKSKSL